MNSAEIAQIFNLLTNATRMEHAQDVKVLSSAVFFWVTFLLATFLFYDVLRGKRRKIAGTSWHKPLIAGALAFYSLAFFGAVRFLDGLSDQAFILMNPSAVTTLSQQTWAYEGSFLLASFAIFIFGCVYGWRYMKTPPACKWADRRKKS